MEYGPFQVKTIVLLFTADNSDVARTLSPNLQTPRFDEPHDGIAILQLSAHALLRDEFLKCLGDVNLLRRQLKIVADNPLPLWSARVIQPATQILNVLPDGEATPIGTVVIGRKPLPSLQVYIRNNEVHLGATVIPVLRPDNGKPVWVHPGNQKIVLKAFDQLKARLRATGESRCIVLGEAQNPRRISLGEPQGVD